MDEPKFDAYSLPELGARINVPSDNPIQYLRMKCVYLQNLIDGTPYDLLPQV